ncbi:MAG: hypothetical protein ABI551_17045 [Polyangiaceae bacterium]
MRKARSLPLLLTLLASGAFATVHTGCGGGDDGSTFGSDSGADGSGETDGSTSYDSGGGFGGDGSTGPHADFPATPIIDSPDGGTGGAPANAPALFGGATATDAGADAPCLVQTEVGSLLPRNWLRPRFAWEAGGGENLFEIRVHADNQVNDLVVYTASQQWTMPDAMWKSLARDSAGVPMTVSVRGGVFDGTTLTALSQGSSGPFGIAPVDAPGAIVYWHIIGAGAGELKGFSIGDEDVQTALPATQVKQYSTTCVGCHVSTPDGQYAVFSSNSATTTWADGIGALSGADAGVGTTPAFLTADGNAALQTNLVGIMTTSNAHWSAGDYMVMASSIDNKSLQWARLDGTGAAATGVLPITGDPNAKHTSPQWSHDGKNVVYTSAPQSASGRPSGTSNDVYVAPYNDKAGGAAHALANANTAANEYYPSYSPDDQWVVFNRTADNDTYSVAGAEVYVAKADGTGTATRLAANDPPACSSRKSPGVTNSWPRWAPAKPSPQTVNGLTYYWVVFSSKRLDGTVPQLYMAPVVVDASGNVKQYQGVYLWNQPAAEKNHTPAWDTFAIPPSPSNPR